MRSTEKLRDNTGGMMSEYREIVDQIGNNLNQQEINFVGADDALRDMATAARSLTQHLGVLLMQYGSIEAKANAVLGYGDGVRGMTAEAQGLAAQGQLEASGVPEVAAIPQFLGAVDASAEQLSATAQTFLDNLTTLQGVHQTLRSGVDQLGGLAAQQINPVGDTRQAIQAAQNHVQGYLRRI